MMAQPIFQEPPSSAFTHSSNYWRSQDSYEYENPNPSETEVCRETKKDFTEARDHLKIVKEALLHFPILFENYPKCLILAFPTNFCSIKLVW